MPHAKLIKSEIDKLPFAEKGVVNYFDTELRGFGLRISQNRKTFFVQRDINTKTHVVNIGSYGIWTPDQARKDAKDKLHLLSKGIDPNEAKKEKQAKTMTLRELADEFYAARTSLKPDTIKAYEGYLYCSCNALDCKASAKHPQTLRGLKDASTTPDTIKQWWRSMPYANIGLVTGAVSGVIVLDVDVRHGGDLSLSKLEQQHGALPVTWRFLTGGGGEHILFRHPGGNVPNSAGKLGSGLDVRGDGGYIVAPPSRHISGNYYAVSEQHAPSTVPLAAAPPWLIELVQLAKMPH
jgi:hypothetical protein